MCFPNTKEWSRRLSRLGAALRLWCFISQGCLLYTTMTGWLTPWILSADVNRFYDPAMRVDVPYKWYAPQEALDETAGLQDYALALAAHDRAWPDSVFLSAALDLATPLATSSAQGVAEF